MRDDEASPGRDTPPAIAFAAMDADLARRLAAIVEFSDDAIISMTLDGIVQSWNRGAERLLGYAADEMIGQPIARLEPPHRRNEVAAIMERLRAGEHIEHFETERIGKDSRIIAVSLTISPIRDAKGRIVGVSKIARDISAKKSGEAALRASEQRFRALVDTQVEMVCRFRLDGTVLFVNEAYARAQGTTTDALIGANFWNFVAEADQPGLRESLLRMTPAEPVLRVENRFETRSGTLWTLWTNRALEFDADGRPVEAQSTGIDITQRKQMEEQLRVMDERKTLFLATLGHELRNPLAPLRTGLDLLGQTVTDPAVAEVRGMMDRQVRHLSRLVDDLVDIARINRGRVELRRGRVDVNSVIEAAVELTSAAVDEYDHRLVLELTSEPAWVDGDFDRLTQVVANLLNNAAKYTPPRGTITVSLITSPDDVAVRIEDTGLGFPPHYADSLFEMFAQVPPLERPPGESGLGIGLPLSRQLVELHGGTILGRSRGPGTGSMFEVRLPWPEPAEPAAGLAIAGGVPPGDAHSAAGGRQRRILVVDDNIDAATVLARLLGQFGHLVEVVHDGESAIDLVDGFAPDVVLLDIGLPRMDGYAVAREIRGRPVGKSVRLFALTGWGQEHDKRLAEEAGFDAHFTKPADTQTLLKHIEM
ncbi:MAG TPA: PAS domain S-box protein [Woeseiaceae bacterium]|nr:PAS domain S-box protein [Woeseiaceae bacterium]